jgi:hypothetical protein
VTTAIELAPGRAVARLRIYREAPGEYLAILMLRTRRGPLAIEVRVYRPDDAALEEEAQAAGDSVAGDLIGDASSAVTQSIVRPLLDKVAAFLNHPGAALAAAATVMIPGLGVGWLVSYALGQSVVDYTRRKLGEG